MRDPKSEIRLPGTGVPLITPMNMERRAPSGSDLLEQMSRQGCRIETILRQVEALPDPAARELAGEFLESVLGFYGSGLGQILRLIEQSGPGGPIALERLARDPLVSGLLLVHGVHPHDLRSRLEEALARVRPYLNSHGGDVELIGLGGGFARLRFKGACKSCPSSALTLERAIRQSIEEVCPDLSGFELEEAAPPTIQPLTHWLDLGEANALPNGGLRYFSLQNTGLVVCRVKDQIYAFLDRCPACNFPLHLGALEGDLLACPEGHRFSLSLAGQCPEKPDLRIAPFPLIEERGRVRVAVAS
jgi:Fe-S cluster biogenesis protein NfuA/nitrite reductase/ring-hydroxylating ferredoxin subunit